MCYSRSTVEAAVIANAMAVISSSTIDSADSSN